jgi:hypothetical protein
MILFFGDIPTECPCPQYLKLVEMEKILRNRHQTYILNIGGDYDLFD